MAVIYGSPGFRIAALSRQVDSDTIHRDALSTNDEGRVKISELAAAAGLSVATVKYYLREGLLSAGERSGPNQAAYGDDHLRRLRLIRTLRTVGGLDIERIRRVVAAIDDQGLARHELFGVVDGARAPSLVAGVEAKVAADAPARAEIDAMIDELGWQVRTDAAARTELATALMALRGLGRDYGSEVFKPYAEAADRMAAWEVESIPHSVQRSAAVEQMVVGTVVFGAVFDALRRLAHEHYSALSESEREGRARSRAARH